MAFEPVAQSIARHQNLLISMEDADLDRVLRNLLIPIVKTPRLGRLQPGSDARGIPFQT